MSRSSLRARSSCAATRRWRDSWSSSISRTLRSTRPAWAARSRIEPLLRRVHRVAGWHRDGERTEQLAAVADREDAAPSNGPGAPRRRSETAPRPGSSRGPPGHGAELAADVEPDLRAVGAGRPRQDPAIRGRTSSVEYGLATRSENSLITSYGVARRPYTSRWAIRRSANVRTSTSANTATMTIRTTVAIAAPADAVRPMNARARATRPRCRRSEAMRTSATSGLLDHDVDVVEPEREDRDQVRGRDPDEDPEARRRPGSRRVTMPDHSPRRPEDGHDRRARRSRRCHRRPRCDGDEPAERLALLGARAPGSAGSARRPTPRAPWIMSDDDPRRGLPDAG